MAASRADRDDGFSDLDLDALDDTTDREELRRRYYGLLQEVRVVVPGVQVLLAFLLTVPFAARFEDLDRAGRTAFGVALLAALLAATCLLTPTLLHHVGERTARSARLAWSVRLTVVGLGALGVALLAALWCVARFIYAPWIATTMTVAAAAVIALLGVALPLRLRRRGNDPPDTAGDER